MLIISSHSFCTSSAPLSLFVDRKMSIFALLLPFLRLQIWIINLFLRNDLALLSCFATSQVRTPMTSVKLFGGRILPEKLNQAPGEKAEFSFFVKYLTALYKKSTYGSRISRRLFRNDLTSSIEQIDIRQDLVYFRRQRI